MKIRLLNQYFTIQELWKLRRSLGPFLFSPQKIWNLLKVHRDLALKRTRIFGMPYIVMVEPCSFCDMACPMCPVVLNQTRRPPMSLQLPVFEKLLAEIGRELILITFWNFGEPLLNRDLFAMIREAKQYQIFCAVSSNLLSLNPDRAEEMIHSKLDYLIVSFDGATRETYEKYRGRGNYDKVINNLRYLVSRRNELKESRPFINLQFIVMRGNEGEIEAIRRFARELKVDKLSLKKFSYISEGTEDFIPENPAFVLKKYRCGEQLKFCSRPWTSAVLNADGSVFPCCGDLDFKYRMGDLESPSSSFRDIWNNQRYRGFRAAIRQDITKIPMCRTCASVNYMTDLFLK